ncbi:S41 family peptidase [Gudongella sp. DL1XJH-153]|uniref:S41 family peptidase n=1 Tax=Gudongella sp. DL1XJH-153 TaxID=3409804 RepID=UPI003BB638D6
MKKLLTLLLVVSLLLPTTVFAQESSLGNIQSFETEADLELMTEVYNFIQEAYPLELDNKAVIEGGLKGMLQAIDPYSDYYTPEEASELYMELMGFFTGIGIYIEKEENYITIVDTIEGANAREAGLLPEDVIISIDGIDTRDMPLSEASSMIKGVKGTTVKLGIKRSGVDDILYFEIIRDEIVINPVAYSEIEEGIGYINLSEFSQTAAIETRRALGQFNKSGIRKIILDLRDNPGGLLDQAVKIAKEFVAEGPIVHIREKNSALLTYSSYNEVPDYDLVLLVNENSASASEILAGAIRDRNAGTIIGKKTFGKGIVQSIIPLENGSLIKMTTAEYLTPKYRSIHGIGIEPDIVVENIERLDLQLQRAIELLQ